ncbi:MAG: response regulator, partial [bacterium]|nr:response regulator [bacterium]
MARVLVVDDEEFLVKHLARLIRRDGHEVRASRNVADAVQHAKDFSPEVLVSDWLLQDQRNGLELAAQLRVGHPDLALIIMTGYPTEELTTGDESGRFQIMKKPFGTDAMLAAIRLAARSTASAAA